MWRPASEPPDDGRRVWTWNGLHHVAQHSQDGWYVTGIGYLTDVTHWRELPPPPSDRPTVRVRAACWVDSDGAWAVVGDHGWHDDAAADEASGGEYSSGGSGRLSWAEWDAPLPEPVEAETIEAEVTDG